VRPYARGNLRLSRQGLPSAEHLRALLQTTAAQPDQQPDLRPESIYSFEIEHSHRSRRPSPASPAAYANYVTNLIQSVGAGVEGGPNHAMSTPHRPMLSLVARIGVSRAWRKGWMLEASYSYQHSPCTCAPVRDP